MIPLVMLAQNKRAFWLSTAASTSRCYKTRLLTISSQFSVYLLVISSGTLQVTAVSGKSGVWERLEGLGNCFDCRIGGNMLILTRRTSETIVIGDDIRVTVIHVDGNQVRIGVKAPKDISVHREEIYKRVLAERQDQKVSPLKAKR